MLDIDSCKFINVSVLFYGSDYTKILGSLIKTEFSNTQYLKFKQKLESEFHYTILNRLF